MLLQVKYQISIVSLTALFFLALSKEEGQPRFFQMLILNGQVSSVNWSSFSVRSFFNTHSSYFKYVRYNIKLLHRRQIVIVRHFHCSYHGSKYVSVYY
jgi:hypothetical protein